MISTTLRIVMLVAVAVYFYLVLRLLKKKSLNLKYTLLWLLSGIIMLILAVFPQILNGFATAVGIYEPTNALFAVILSPICFWTNLCRIPTSSSRKSALWT